MESVFRRVLRTAAVLSVAFIAASAAQAEMVLSNSVYEAETLRNTNVVLNGVSELHITGDSSPITGSIFNMISEDAWVFMHATLPSGVNVSRFQVNGVAAVNGTNIRIVQYGQGAVIIPQASDFQPMEVFSGKNFQGDSMSLSPYTSYSMVLRGKVSSFVLKRGYMATLSKNSNGTGVALNYVASDGDLRIAALPDDLDNEVRFVRIYPWRWVAKKGSCDIAASALDARWYYNWNVTSQAANSDYEYVAIKQQRWWPGLPGVSDCEYLGVNHVSGYNEPNNSVEDAYTSLNDGDVATAVSAWTELEGTGLRIGAPAVTDGGYSWIVDFLEQAEAAGRRVDYIPIHYYRASDNTASGASSALYTFLKSVYDVAHKPIWLTEFNNGANWTTATDPTFAQNETCIEAMVNMMDETPWIERYSVYSAVEEVRQVYYDAGGYTPMGQMYKDHESPIGYQQIIPCEGMDPSAQYSFENRLSDESGAGNHAMSHNYPDFVAGHNGGTAIQFNGEDDHVILPDSLSDGTDFSFAAWVYWDGGNSWQRIFDFGIMDSDTYMFLTPMTDSGSGATMRFSMTTSGWSGEQRLTSSSALPENAWTHVAVTIEGNTGRLFMNGTQVAINSSMTLNPSDLGAIQHYLGRSMFPSDPYFSGKLDDVIIADYKLTSTQIAALMENEPPVVAADLVDGGAIKAGDVYSGSVAGNAEDPESGTITYSKVYGSDWVSVASDGTVSGTPAYADAGTEYVTVRATDTAGSCSYFTLQVVVNRDPYNFAAGPVAYWNFADEGAANGSYLPGNGDRDDLDGDGAMDTDDFRIGSTDLSGNGNHLTAWTSSWMKWSSDSDRGDFSMVYANSYPAAGTDSSYNPEIQAAGYTNIDVEAITPTQWSVEAIFKPGSVSGIQTVLGRDGRYVGGGSSDLAALYLSLNGTALRILYVDVEGGQHDLQVAAGLSVGVWYQAAATSDGETLRLYLDGSQIGSLDLTTTGTDTALGLGYGMWSVARGMYADGHTDRFTGKIDAVAISGVTLTPSSFVLNDEPPPEAPTGLTAVSGDSQVDLSWNSVTNATDYAVKVSVFSGGPYTEIAGPEITSFVHVGLPNGTNLYYVVSALNDGGESADSDEVHAIPSVDITTGEYYIAQQTVSGGTNVSLTVSNSVLGHLYLVLATDSLTAPVWTPVDDGETGDGKNLLFDLPVDEASSNRYFKLDVQRQ